MNDDLIKQLAEMLSSDVSGDAYILLADCKAEIERLSKPYVPMTDDDFISLIEKTGTFNRYSGWEWEGEVETAVIARYNEQRGVK